MINNPTGTVDKIKLVTSYPDMLVRFSLIVDGEIINCICGDTSICNSLLFLEDGKTQVALFGIYNSRKQLVVKKMFIKNPTSFEKEFAVRCLA
ncbi:hypothetical protein [Vagococcus fluvialis]|uniref:hypothetical protein n=1 Tax=Vagococcus fluvialis TaxID=2738 RepID=UPI001D0A8645|nr:hypothetical protein [Vagococcus fluvialis]UDM72545.1 hypothetical protein K5L00_06580 [Vagococcus fluvialis]UDM77241.1 hypothetical protein K5K98_02120 [Vagococcus fluvialis]UDM81511.1 hypothetical protein K5K96_09055 [Vagococcus fluvialis]